MEGWGRGEGRKEVRIRAREILRGSGGRGVADEVFSPGTFGSPGTRPCAHRQRSQNRVQSLSVGGVDAQKTVI